MSDGIKIEKNRNREKRSRNENRNDPEEAIKDIIFLNRSKMSPQ
jgi:hypothetical protein